jgi:hypothetical protein
VFDRKVRDEEGRRMGGRTYLASTFVDEQLREMARGRAREDAYQRARMSVLRDGPAIAAASRLPANLVAELEPEPVLELSPSQAMQGVLERQLQLLRSRLRVKSHRESSRAKMHFRTFRDEETNRAVQLRELGGEGQWSVVRKAALEARDARLRHAEVEGRLSDEEQGVITDDELAAFELSDDTLAAVMQGGVLEEDEAAGATDAASAERLTKWKDERGAGRLLLGEALDIAASRAATDPEGALALLGVETGTDEATALLTELQARQLSPGKPTGWGRRLGYLDMPTSSERSSQPAVRGTDEHHLLENAVPIAQWKPTEGRLAEEDSPSVPRKATRRDKRSSWEDHADDELLFGEHAVSSEDGNERS